MSEKTLCKSIFYPSISLINPVYNIEKTVSQFITSLFENASSYPGFCEIIIVDDGSKDYTYEVAWAAIQKNQEQRPNIRAKLIRHSVKLGKTEAAKTGARKALGKLIIIIHNTEKTNAWLKRNTLKKLIETAEKNHGTSTRQAQPNKHRLIPKLINLETPKNKNQNTKNMILTVPGLISVYKADFLL
ncbi:MAG: glycosyltransferase family 2 protein [Candidatus Bathyarchaeia archaeon]